MTIPSGSNFPAAYDTDDNLFMVHDSLRLVLSEDYTPGDTSITMTGDADAIASFPPTGLITLTEQCSEPELRAISFYYGSRTITTFDELELLSGFQDVGKPKNYTYVTQNVMDKHHNSLKDACIAIEEFIGVEGTVDTAPFGLTLVGRLNFLRRLVLSPRAWFTANKRIGIVPLTVTFQDESLRDPTSWVWTFGDGVTSPSGPSPVSTASNISTPTLTPIISGAVPCGDITSPTEAERTITHTYFTPGQYDVTLEIGNKFGRDTLLLPDIINARAPAPDEATLLVAPTKARANQLVNIEVVDNGEQTDSGGDPIDAVTEYTWKLSDDLPHNSAPEAVALYSVGGIYDVKVRIDTELGAYRITSLEGVINIVEQSNLWLTAFDSASTTLATTKKLRTYEFGLVSESWKSEVMPELDVQRDYSFTSGYPNEEYQRNLFLRNNGFAQKGSIASGDRGQGVIYWSEDESTIRYKQFEPFDEVWSSAGFDFGDTQTRNWNWMTFSDNLNIYVLFGLSSISGSPSAPIVGYIKNDMGTLSSTSDNYSSAELLNGADELGTLADSAPATYRACFRDTNGFFARNDSGPGGFFRIRSFYRSEGNFSDYASSLRKLPDIPGTARTELQLAPLASGIFVFNNSGEVAAYNPTTNVWTTGGPGVGSAVFRSLQDSSVEGYAESSQSLIATSDGDRKVYLSYDYSPNAFVKFNEADLTFSSLGARPTSNEQFSMLVF
jgi:PKD repeat protein